MFRPELYAIIEAHTSLSFKAYKINELFQEVGHTVLWLPLYHPDFNLIELIWSLLKERVAKNIVTLKIDSVELLVKETCDSITQL